MVIHKHIKLNNFSIGNNLPLVLIAGPCQLESESHALEMADALVSMASKLSINFIYKSSFDKANRTSVSGKRGIGLEKSLPIFEAIKNKYGCPVLTDVHNEDQCKVIGEVVDVLQIPAFLCRQTDLLKAAAQTNKVINIKKGQFLAPWDMKNIVEKMISFGNDNILLTERGVSFGYNTLVSDMRSLPIMGETGMPVVFDATHSVQQPGGMGQASGGQRHFVSTLAKAATAVGIAAVFLETHQDPDNAPSDGPCMVKLNELPLLMKQLIEFDKLAKQLP
ncbi:2-dehydro-3-deoxyphosphooctonate aldolase [Rickettsiales bacterium Ac37b]|nr:2-dehydro-3-deoxyphosphooctonate aldolase [Rickettsiales bacterium Ac37b]